MALDLSLPGGSGQPGAADGGAAPHRMTWARRATIVSPRARVDVALPVQSTIAELVPELVRLSDAQRHATPGQSGWALARLGDAPLGSELTVAAAGLRDGDVLYLMPRNQHGAPMLFDDVVDAIASASENSAALWRPRTAHAVASAAGAVALAGATVLLFALLGGRASAPIAVGATLPVLLAGGGVLARALDDARAAAAWVAAGVPGAFLAGASALAPHKFLPLHSGSVALGIGAVAAYSALAMVATRAWSAWFGALAGAGALGAAAASVVANTSASDTQAGAVLAVVATALAALAPLAALRLSRLPMPRVPSDATAFRTEDVQTLGPDVLGRTTVAQRMLTGLLGALGAAVAGGAAATLRGDGVWPIVLTALLGVVWLLRARSYSDMVQRVVLTCTGLVTLAALAVCLVARGDSTLLLVGIGALAAIGAGCFVNARHSAQGRHSPYWRRLLDVAEFLGVVALLPIAGFVIGVYEHLGHLRK